MHESGLLVGTRNMRDIVTSVLPSLHPLTSHAPLLCSFGCWWGKVGRWSHNLQTHMPFALWSEAQWGTAFLCASCLSGIDVRSTDHQHQKVGVDNYKLCAQTDTVQLL